MRRLSPLSLSLPALGLLACGGAGTAPAAVASAPGDGPDATAPYVAPPPPAASKPAYPDTPKVAVVDTYRSVKVTDDYRWLEDWNDPKVQAWSEAENAFARKILDAAPGREKIHARLEQLMNDSSPSWAHVTARKGTFLALETRPPKQHPYLVTMTSLDDVKGARVLVDPNAIDKTGGTAIGWFVPSLDGRRVAVSLSKGGAEHGEVHVFEVASGKELKDVVPQADGAGEGDCLAWKADGSGFYYTRGHADGPSQNAFQRVSFHKLGDPVDKDMVVVGKEASRLAQWELIASDDGRTILARWEDGDSGAWEQWLLGPSGTWVRVATVADEVKALAAGPDGSLYLLSARGAPRRRVLRTTVSAPSLETAELVVPEGDSVITDVVPTRTRMYLLETVGGVAHVRTMALSKGKPGAPSSIATPAVAAIAGLTPIGGDDVTFAVTTYTQPTAVYRVNGKDGTAKKTALAETSSADFSGVEVTREECTSKDGTHIPLTLLRSASTAKNGEVPTLLTGYGGFGMSIEPRFRSQTLAWLEQGGTQAIANIRGGGEFGETWHTGGNLTNKQNVFDDLAACAQHLVEAKYTTPAHLAILGRSNGGLLMGAELTQHAQAFKAVVSLVGIYDMLRLEHDPNGAYNTTEYGSVADPKQFDALYAYSPYHHVKDGVAYPATLFMTGANDPRVAPYHSRKMVARLQAATSSDAPILLRTSANTGHGIGSPLSATIEENTDIDAFLFQQLGVAYQAK